MGPSPIHVLVAARIVERWNEKRRQGRSATDDRVAALLDADWQRVRREVCDLVDDALLEDCRPYGQWAHEIMCRTTPEGRAMIYEITQVDDDGLLDWLDGRE